MDKEEWCPTRSVKTRGYKAQVKNEEKWSDLAVNDSIDGAGIPYPRLNGGILYELGLQGFAQANAVAWDYAAKMALHGRDVDVRVQEYEIEASMKARAKEPK